MFLKQPRRPQLGEEENMAKLPLNKQTKQTTTTSWTQCEVREGKVEKGNCPLSKHMQFLSFLDKSITTFRRRKRRPTETQTQTETERETDTDRQRQREKQKQTDRQTETLHRETDRQTDRNREREREVNIVCLKHNDMA